MAQQKIKWILYIVPALVIGGFETIRHTFLQNLLPMEIGNWVTAVIDAIVIALVSQKLFSQFEKTIRDLSRERETRVLLEDRERTARELHDRIAQIIFYTGVKLQTTKKMLDKMTSEELQLSLHDVTLSLREIDENTRQAIFNLREKNTVSNHFEDRIKQFMKQALEDTQIKWKLSFPTPLAPIEIAEEVQLFGILQEAIHNVKKHANATLTQVSFRILNVNADRGWEFVIQDNGIGFNLSEIKERSFGLAIMNSRVADIGAKISINSNTSGTLIQVYKDL